MEKGLSIFVESRRKKISTIELKHGDCTIIDVTSKGAKPWVEFSPFYPHGGIPVPLSPGFTAYSVEGIWQGLKVFETEGVDTKRFANQSMKGIKRTCRKYGRVLGHSKGVNGKELLSYLEARLQIYLPAYKYVLDNHLSGRLAELKRAAGAKKLVLLDYETNCDIQNLAKPLSHAGLIKSHLLGNWP